MSVSLSPQASASSAMSLVQPSRASRVVARLLVAAFFLIAVVLSVTPWQQSAPGTGRVVAYAPDERRQNLEAPIEGRVLRWFVREGSVVKQGDPIMDLTDNDPDIVMRLRSERDAIAARLEAATARARSLESRVNSLQDSRQSGIAASESRIRMAAQRVVAAEQAVTLANATLTAAKLNIERQRLLADQGLTSKRQLELTELEEARAQTEVERAKVTLAAARSEEIALTSDRQKIGNDGSASISDAQAAQSAAEAEVANSSAELSRIEVRLARQSAQSVVAPRDGIVFRIVANGHTGEIVKAGDVLAVLVPDTTDRAVELWVSGNDMPLVHEGAQARIQFEGWPALQFSGWPSVAVGTFGGRVSFVDATDNGAGLFRVLVVPEEGSTWPAPIYLRQGVRTKGWIQLGRVQLGYELWRQFNGFPPSLPQEPASAPAGGKAEAPKGEPK
jgi:membrane fusion protein, adhesin transport system